MPVQLFVCTTKYSPSNPIGTKLRTVCDNGGEGSCGGAIGGLWSVNVFNRTAGYDSLDGLLDFHLDHVMGQPVSNGCTGGLSLGGFCGSASLGGILVAELEGGDITQANSEVVRAEFANQLVEHLDSELDEFEDYLGSLNRTQFQRRFGLEREGTIGLYRIQLGDLRGALVRKTVEDFIIESGVNVLEYLVPKPKIGGRLGMLAEMTDFFLPAPPVFDLSGFTVDCRGSTCGVVTPSDDLVVIKKR